MALRTTRKMLAVALLWTVTASAFGWGREGHRLVALVAADHLSPVAIENVKVLLGRETMADIASFGDDYRSEHPETGQWHYVDIPGTEKVYNRDRDCPAPLVNGVADKTATWRDCAVDRISYFVGILKDPESAKPQRIFALKMLVHLVGDLHQPMHAIGDARGGNSNRITVFGTKQCGERQICNLHSTWDSGLIEHTRMNEKKYLATLEEEITSLKLETKPVGTPIAWANSSHRAAVEAWVPDGGIINDEYWQAEGPVLNRELELGGLHLANLLNGVFTQLPPGSEVVIKPTPDKVPLLKPR